MRGGNETRAEVAVHVPRGRVHKDWPCRGGRGVILCEHGPKGQPVRFMNADELLICRHAADVRPTLHRLEEARAKGAWIAGYIAYEAGYAMEPRLAALMPAERPGPLIAFGIYREPQAFAPLDPPGVKPTLAPFAPLITAADHRAAVGRVQDYIAAGDCYQVNLTFPMESRLTEGSPLDLYQALRAHQPVGFGSFIDFAAGQGQDQGPVIVSRSPELFFATDAGGAITARPMKGTAPRHPDPVEDAALAEALRASIKDRAENLMIVDLLRNDISRLARPGTVKVPELYAVDSFATVHQMSSRVIGQLAAPARFDTLMEALFPCGSITGAPKIRAMEIIAELEPFARGVYCGAIGWMAPDGSSSFSVAIRTLSVTGDRVRLNVGGGIVQDSTPEGEWEEALWKAAYAQALTTRG